MKPFSPVRPVESPASGVAETVGVWSRFRQQRQSDRPFTGPALSGSEAAGTLDRLRRHIQGVESLEDVKRLPEKIITTAVQDLGPE